MEIVVTNSEVEALLLESNLIKRFQPRYNVLLRDDKSFPYILLTADHDFAQVTKHRGAHRRKGDYFGPFAQRQVRQSNRDSAGKGVSCCGPVRTAFSKNRTRPCLLYQIKRCSAPLCGQDRSGRVRRAGGRGERFSLWRKPPHPGRVGRIHAKKPQKTLQFERAPPCCVTDCVRSVPSKRIRT